MKILLTGHEGYIGSNLYKKLLETGHKVVTVDGDLLKVHDDFFIGDRLDFIIHLAAFAGVRASLEDPEKYLNNNVYSTRKIFKMAEKTKAKVLFASSSNAKEWWVNPYAMTKRMNELDAPNYNVRSVGMRFHTVWPGREDMLYKRLHAGTVKYINENHTRDFIHIEDLLSAICTIIQNYDIITKYEKNRVVDIGSGHATPVVEVAHKFGFDGEFRNDPTPHERKATIADVEWLHQLGWGPQRNILV